MTICVSVKVSEGLVLAADSTSTLQGSLVMPDGTISPPQILKTFNHARKLSHIKDYPIGTLAWGGGEIGSRTIESLIKEYEYHLPSLEEEYEKLKERRMRGESAVDTDFPYSVEQIAKNLFRHVKGAYEAAHANTPVEQRPVTGILVSGYSAGQFFPEQWALDIPNSPEIIRIRPDESGKPVFGANWYGMTDAIVRLHWGRDDQALALLAQRFQVEVSEIHSILEPFQYPVPFEGMPLQDAIDYAVYLVNVVIGRFRFSIGPEFCGGDIDVAVVTPDAFTWIRRKSWRIS
jgi:hypothetical protein